MKKLLRTAKTSTLYDVIRCASSSSSEQRINAVSMDLLHAEQLLLSRILVEAHGGVPVQVDLMGSSPNFEIQILRLDDCSQPVRYFVRAAD